MHIKLQCIIAAILLLNCISCGPSPNQLKEKEAIEQLSSEDWEIRKKGLFTLSDADVKDHKTSREAQKKLLDVIEKEAQMYKGTDEKLQKEGKSVDEAFDELHKKYPPQTYGDYIKALALILASENVENSMPTIFKLIVDTNYNISPTILALYGSKCLNFFVEKATNGTGRERETALSVLAIWISPSDESDEVDVKSIPTLSENDLKIAENVFIKAINDSDYNVRYLVLSSLGSLIDRPEVHMTVEKVSKSDSEQFIRRKAVEILKTDKRKLGD